MIGKSLGLAPARMQMLRRAALLHDIGKLSVSNMILDKPGHLDDNEFRLVKRHAALTREILSRMPSLDEISVIAGEHHEKLDGTGYPFGLKAQQLSLESRLIAVADVYGALSEDRPYRPRLDPEEIFRIMKKDVPGKLDGECFEALRAVWPQAPRHAEPVSADWSSATAQPECVGCGVDREVVNSATAATVPDAVVRQAASRNSALPPADRSASC
jgi:HD-GYP domain-containing protein (c-di-GMP phosphodiesterase class II)